MKGKYIFVLILGLWIISVKAENQVNTADSAYLSGDFAKAIELYNQVATEQGVSAPLLYNLGNAYYQNDDFGRAMLCYQRAKKIDPSNKLINQNLSFLKEKIDDANKAEQKGKKKKVEEDTPNFFQSLQKGISEDHSSNMWAGWAAAFFLIFSGCAALYLFTSNVILRKTGFFGGFIMLGLSLIFVVIAYSSASSTINKDYGIITGFKVSLQTEPTETSDDKKTEGILTRGTKVRIISEETDAEGVTSWYKVRLNSDYNGWLKASEIEII